MEAYRNMVRQPHPLLYDNLYFSRDQATFKHTTGGLAEGLDIIMARVISGLLTELSYEIKCGSSLGNKASS